ncbi:MAG: stage II sporulation protein M [Actinomycetota bacterium]|nr:stage II sporulation protein M [Actinomycetota bacterium]
MDLDVFVTAHRDEWARLEYLVSRAGRPRRLSGPDVDELVELYQRTATHLSVVQTRSPDPALVGRLSSLVARARAAVTGGRTPAWRDATRFLTVTFPVVVYRGRRWCAGVAAGFLLVAFLIGRWVATSADVQRRIAPPNVVRDLVERDFAGYYSAHPASAFAAEVWTHNAFIAAGTLVLGVLLGLPTIYLLWTNAANVGVAGGLMAANGRLGLFFGLISPHGLLELTAVFIAAGVGLRLGWTVIDPGPSRRADALARQGRAAVAVAVGLVLVLALSGGIEAFVTPSPLPTWARVGLGVLVEAGFLVYIGVLGRRGVAAGETGDLAVGFRPDELPAGCSPTVGRPPSG